MFTFIIGVIAGIIVFDAMYGVNKTLDEIGEMNDEMERHHKEFDLYLKQIGYYD